MTTRGSRKWVCLLLLLSVKLLVVVVSADDGTDEILLSDDDDDEDTMVVVDEAPTTLLDPPDTTFEAEEQLSTESSETVLGDQQDEPLSPTSLDDKDETVVVEPSQSNNAEDAAAAAAAATQSVLSEERIDGLKNLSMEELESICTERGFVLEKKGAALTHDDYVQAAATCLSIEDEMNAVFAENPELEEQLEEELERMKSEKERLEVERRELLQTKAELQSELREAGVDPERLLPEPTSTATTTLRPASQELERHLRESFEMLFDRVGRDMRLVGKATRTILQPVVGGVALVWRYSEPTAAGLTQKALGYLDNLLATKYAQSVRRIGSQQVGTMKRLAIPLMVQGKSQIVAWLRRLNRIERIHKASAIAGAFLGPLRESLLQGWKSIRPDAEKIARGVATWIGKQKALA